MRTSMAHRHGVTQRISHRVSIDASSAWCTTHGVKDRFCHCVCALHGVTQRSSHRARVDGSLAWCITTAAKNQFCKCSAVLRLFLHSAWSDTADQASHVRRWFVSMVFNACSDELVLVSLVHNAIVSTIVLAKCMDMHEVKNLHTEWSDTADQALCEHRWFLSLVHTTCSEKSVFGVAQWINYCVSIDVS